MWPHLAPQAQPASCARVRARACGRACLVDSSLSPDDLCRETAQATRPEGSSEKLSYSHRNFVASRELVISARPAPCPPWISDAATLDGPAHKLQARSKSRESMRHRSAIYHLSLAESHEFWPLKRAYQALRSPRLVLCQFQSIDARECFLSL